MKAESLLVLICMLCATSACTTTIPVADNPRAKAHCCTPDPLRHAPLEVNTTTVQSEEKTVTDNFLVSTYSVFHSMNYHAFKVEFPGNDGEMITAHLFLPTDAPPPHPVVIIFPVLGGTPLISEILAMAFVERGFATFRIDRRGLSLRRANEETLTEEFRHSLLDARRGIDWLVAHPDIDATRVAVSGISVGGIMATTLLGIDDRIDAGVAMLSGGNLPKILFYSTEGAIEIFRGKLQERLGQISEEQYIEFLSPHTKMFDPLTYASCVDPRQILLISARGDSVIPPKQTHELWEALGKPEWTQLPGGHYSSFPFFLWSAEKAAEFLHNYWEQKDE